MTIVTPEIDELLDQVDSKFTLCTLAAKRSRQINDMIHGVRDQALSAMATSEIAKLTSAKPLSLAMDEVASGDVAPDGVEEVDVVDAVDEDAHAESVEGSEAIYEEPLPNQAEKDALPEVDGLIG